MKNVIKLLEEKLEFHQKLVDDPGSAEIWQHVPKEGNLYWFGLRQLDYVNQYKKAIKILEQYKNDEDKKLE